MQIPHHITGIVICHFITLAKETSRKRTEETSFVAVYASLNTSRLLQHLPEVDPLNHHIAQILSRRSPRGDQYYPVRAILLDELAGPLETVILAVKTHFTDAAMWQYGPLLAPT